MVEVGFGILRMVHQHFLPWALHRKFAAHMSMRSCRAREHRRKSGNGFGTQTEAEAQKGTSPETERTTRSCETSGQPTESWRAGHTLGVI